MQDRATLESDPSGNSPAVMMVETETGEGIFGGKTANS